MICMSPTGYNGPVMNAGFFAPPCEPDGLGYDHT